MNDKKTLKKRSEVDKQFKWRIEDLYLEDSMWEEELRRLDGESKKISGFRGRLSESADVLFEYFKLSDEISMVSEKIYVYANQRLHEDTSNTKYQDYSNKAQSLMIKITSLCSFVVPEILEIPEEKLNLFLESEGIGVYKKHIMDIVRQKEHALSAEMEELLAEVNELADAPENIFSMFNNADLRFPEIVDENGDLVAVTHGRYISFLESKDQNVRKSAFMAMYGMYEKYKNTLAATFSANIKKDVFYARTRKYKSSLLSALDDSNVSVEVYDNLITTVHENLPLMHRYVKLRKRILGLDELHMYDLFTPMVSDFTMKIDFMEAKEMVKKGLSPLGKDYLKILDEGFNNGWIDIYENEGKRSGAYSWGAYGTHPYVLLNYHDNLNNVFTLAHEMGHAIHSYLSDKTQPYIYAGYKIFVAEVASTCNEALLMDYLLKETKDKKEKAYLINYFLEQFRTTLYRQTMFAEFEKITHQMVLDGESLTAETLCKIYRDLNIRYFGDGIVIDEEINMEWARIPHFYNSFYVYQYATGYSAAIALSQKILNEGESAVNAYLNFLSGGSSDYPIELLRGAGVDMSNPKPVKDALMVFERLLEQMEELFS